MEAKIVYADTSIRLRRLEGEYTLSSIFADYDAPQWQDKDTMIRSLQAMITWLRTHAPESP